MPQQVATTILTPSRSDRSVGSSTNAGRSQISSFHGDRIQGVRIASQRFLQPAVRQIGRERAETFVSLSEASLVIGANRKRIKLDGAQQENYPGSVIENPPQMSQAFQSPIEAMLVRVARLQPGWAGSRSVVPPDSVQTDLVRFASYLPASLTAPEVEVDPEDGTVTLIWERNLFNEGTFAIVFTGSGYAIGVSPSDPDYKPWRLAIADEWSIIDHLEGEGAIGSLLS